MHICYSKLSQRITLTQIKGMKFLSQNGRTPLLIISLMMDEVLSRKRPEGHPIQKMMKAHDGTCE